MERFTKCYFHPLFESPGGETCVRRGVVRVYSKNNGFSNTSKALGRVRSRGSLRASLTAFAAVLASPGSPEPASPFQSTRSPGDPPAVPGGLKGRAAVDPSRARQAPQRSEERGSKDGSASRLSSSRKSAIFGDSEPRSGRAPRGLSRPSCRVESQPPQPIHASPVSGDSRRATRVCY